MMKNNIGTINRNHQESGLTTFFYSFAIAMFSLMFLRIVLPDFLGYVETGNPVLISIIIATIGICNSKSTQKQLGIGAKRVKNLPLWFLAAVLILSFGLAGIFWH